MFPSKMNLKCAFSFWVQAFLICVLTSNAPAQKRTVFLISAQDLAPNLDSFHIVDVRRKESFEQGHIPGSRWADASAWVAKSSSATGLTDQTIWTKEIQSLGVDNGKPVIVAGESITTTARGWWLLTYLGVKDVRLLEGDYAAWADAKLPISNKLAKIEPSQFQVAFQSKRLATLEDITSASKENTCKILDNRSIEEFTGSRGSGARNGHVPGAIHLEWNSFLDRDGKFLSAMEIRKLVGEKNLNMVDPIAAHCRTGGRSSVAVFAMEMAGATNVKNYYRGWSEYEQHLSEPVSK